MAQFPSSIPTYAGFTSSHTLSADNHAAQHNAEQGDIVALANKMGTGASTPVSGLLLRGTGIGTSSWAQANLTTDVTGVLPQANGGTGRTDSTGTGAPVYQTSPVLTTPTIGSFANANHNHQNSAGGGTLNAANALQAGTVSFANLLTSIFSGQVATYSNLNTAGGTFFYINLGGIKLFWGATANNIGATPSPATYTVDFPTSFFNTVQTCQLTVGPNNTVNGQAVNIVGSGFNTSSVGMTVMASSTTSAEPVQVLVIGT